MNGPKKSAIIMVINGETFSYANFDFGRKGVRFHDNTSAECSEVEQMYHFYENMYGPCSHKIVYQLETYL